MQLPRPRGLIRAWATPTRPIRLHASSRSILALSNHDDDDIELPPICRTYSIVLDRIDDVPSEADRFDARPHIAAPASKSAPINA